MCLFQDIQKFLDSAKHGVILFSMGSNLLTSEIPELKKLSLLQSFVNLKQKVIMKYETDFSEKPKNIMMKNWLPQSAILAHPNLKLLITHGGLLSITEAIYYGIPIIGIPIYGDQRLNVVRAEKAGWGMALSYNNLTEASISWTINHVLSDPK